MNIFEIIMLGGLIGLSAADLRTRKVSVYAVAVFGMAAVTCGIMQGNAAWSLAAGVLPGAFVLLLALCTRESIGIGDGLVLCALGIFCGMERIVAVFGMALFLSALLAMVLLVLKRAGRKTELPFLPCLCAGYLLCVIW